MSDSCRPLTPSAAWTLLKFLPPGSPGTCPVPLDPSLLSCPCCPSLPLPGLEMELGLQGALTGPWCLQTPHWAELWPRKATCGHRPPQGSRLCLPSREPVWGDLGLPLLSSLSWACVLCGVDAQPGLCGAGHVSTAGRSCWSLCCGHARPMLFPGWRRSGRARPPGRVRPLCPAAVPDRLCPSPDPHRHPPNGPRSPGPPASRDGGESGRSCRGRPLAGGSRRCWP